MMDEDEEVIEDCTSPKIKNEVKEVPFDLLPTKSREKYYAQHQLFVKWCVSRKIKIYSESVVLAYLSDLSKKYRPSTLACIYSMLKGTLLAKDNVNIESYKKVTAFLKKQLVGYTPKKTRTFRQQDIERFLQLAPDASYLMMKVVLIIGVSGGCQTKELTKMTIDDVVDRDGVLTIHTKAYPRRTFVVRNAETENFIDVVAICKKYFSLRPSNLNSRRLFVKYRAGRCIAQNVGCHSIGTVPPKVAAFLNLPNHKEYNGHTFRKTAATLFANSRTKVLVLKRRDDWKSISVAEGYSGESLNKISAGSAAASTCTTTALLEDFSVPVRLQKKRLDNSLSNNHESGSQQNIADNSIGNVAIKEEVVEEPEDAIFQVVATIQNHHQTFQSSRFELEQFQNTLDKIKTKEQWVAFLCSKSEEESEDMKIKIEPL